MPQLQAIHPHLVIVMGVSGSGKSTVAGLLSAALGWDLLEGDDLHPAANIAKMHAGQPLTDTDRKPWLEAIAAWAGQQVRAGRSGIITCSALKQSYRDVLREGISGVLPADMTFLLLTGSQDQIGYRLTARMHHYMPPSLLESQLATLEPPTRDENAIVLDIGPAAQDIARQALAALRDRGVRCAAAAS